MSAKAVNSGVSASYIVSSFTIKSLYMNHTEMFAIAKSFYEKERSLAVYNGFHKYVLTNGRLVTFVEFDYVPEEGYIVFAFYTKSSFTEGMLWEVKRDINSPSKSFL